MDIRIGKYKLSEVEAMGKQLQIETYSAQKNSPLPDQVDLEAVRKRITGVYLDFWKSVGS